MGTDIHFYVDQRQPDGSWQTLPSPPRDLERWPRIPRPEDGYVSPFWGPRDCMYEGKCYECNSTGCEACLGTGRSAHWYSCRNYNAFAILADVRNGYAFAGCDTGDGFRPISQPRGMPADATDFVRDHHTWDHTPSWLGLPEILAYDWTQTTIHRGVIPLRREDDRHPFGEPESFTAWDARGGGEPKSYSGGISGRGIVTVSAAQAREMIAHPERIPSEQSVFVTVSWQSTYRESARSFCEFVETFLVPLGDPERTRIVFGFDS